MDLLLIKIPSKTRAKLEHTVTLRFDKTMSKIIAECSCEVFQNRYKNYMHPLACSHIQSAVERVMSNPELVPQ